jgi:hypothetical protein
MTYFYTTTVGTTNNETAFFRGINELLDHLQNVYQCTADELEFSQAWKDGELFKEHVGTLSNEFCESWNKHRVDTDARHDVETLDD